MRGQVRNPALRRPHVLREMSGACYPARVPFPPSVSNGGKGGVAGRSITRGAALRLTRPILRRPALHEGRTARRRDGGRVVRAVRSLAA